MPSNPMIDGHRADSARRRQRVIKAINAAQTNGGELNVSAIARTAGVDGTFLYLHRDLLARIHTAQRTPPTVDNPTLVTAASLETDLANAQARIARLAGHNQQLERKLSEILGERTWHESGLGAPADIDQLQRQSSPSSRRTSDYTPSSRNVTMNSTRPGSRTANCSRT